MALLGGSKYHELIQIYDEAIYLFKQENFHALYPLVNEGLSLLEAYDGWPIITKHPKSLVTANLLFFRAKCIEYLFEPQGEEILELASLYKQVIEILGYKSQARAQIEACFSLIDILLEYRGNNTELAATSCLECAEIAVNVSLASNNQLNYGLSLARQGNVYFRFYASTQETSVELAYECFLKALKIFKELNDKESIFLVNFHLSHLFLSPSIRQHHTSPDWAILYSRQAFECETENCTSKELGILSMNLAKAYSHRKFGDKVTNLIISHGCYKHAISDLYESPITTQWAFIFIDWANLLIDRRKTLEGFFSILDDENRKKLFAILDNESIDDHFPIIDKYTALIFETFEKSEEPEIWFAMLKLREKLSFCPRSDFYLKHWSFRSELGGLLSHFDKKLRPQLWIDIQFEIARQNYKNGNSEAPTIALSIYDNILNSVDVCQWPDVYYEIYICMGNAYCDLKNWRKAYQYFLMVLDDPEKQKGTSSDTLTQGIEIFARNKNIMKILPFVAFQISDIEKTLLYFDYINSHEIATDHEDLFFIEQQINRDSLFKRYIKMKQEQRVSHMQTDTEEMGHTVHFIGSVRSELDSLKKAATFTTRSHFLIHLNQHLPKINHWMLLPILGKKNSRLILIPPNSQLKDVYSSSELDINFASEMKMLANKDRGGWMRAIHDIFKYDDLVDREFSKMEKHLWINYAQWMKQVFYDSGERGIPSLCIIAVGPTAFFPFAMAGSDSLGERLIDSVNISYAPSLYSLFTLIERNKYFDEDPSLGFITGTDDSNLSSIEVERTLIGQCFSQDSQLDVDSKTVSLETVSKVCKKTNHWHIATHGKFEWPVSAASYINIGDNKLRANLILALEPEHYLRLVVLAACETGLMNVITEDTTDPEGLLYKFLEIGAVGVIGALWQQEDESCALLLGKFYYYYLVEKNAPTKALRLAQIWLKSINRSELEEFIREKIPDWNQKDSGACKILEKLKQLKLEECPFKEPCYWAGLILMGQ